MRGGGGTWTSTLMGFTTAGTSSADLKHILKFLDDRGHLIVAVLPDGEVEFGEGVDPGDASRQFWGGAAEFLLEPREKALEQELARLRAVLARHVSLSRDRGDSG